MGLRAPPRSPPSPAGPARRRPVACPISPAAGPLSHPRRAAAHGSPPRAARCGWRHRCVRHAPASPRAIPRTAANCPSPRAPPRRAEAGAVSNLPRATCPRCEKFPKCHCARPQIHRALICRCPVNLPLRKPSHAARGPSPPPAQVAPLATAGSAIQSPPAPLRGKSSGR